MKMDDNELKRLLQEGMEYEADRIMAEVESDPTLKDVVAPEEIYIKLEQQIREHQEQEERERQSRAKEDEELIRLGKIYKKKRSRRKYYVLLVAVLCALGVGTVSFGDGKKVFTKIQGIFNKGTHTRISDGDDDKFDGQINASEEDAYAQINDKFGIHPVRMFYLPEGVKFIEANLQEDLQYVHMRYSDEKNKNISYKVLTKNREGSSFMDIEDKLIGETEKHVGETSISIKEYEIEENKTIRWVVEFVYKEAQYTIVFSGIEENEVEQTVEKLNFM